MSEKQCPVYITWGTRDPIPIGDIVARAVGCRRKRIFRYHGAWDSHSIVVGAKTREEAAEVVFKHEFKGFLAGKGAEASWRAEAFKQTREVQELPI